MPRLTRAETQTRNREQVLAAARRLFLREGYNSTSLAAVADEAGFSTGVVYSNFNGKPDLALQVLRGIQTEMLDNLGHILNRQASPDQLVPQLHEWAEDALASGWPRLELEFALEARGDETLVTAEAERQRSTVHTLAAILRKNMPEPMADALPLDAVAEVALDLLIGFAVRSVIDPNTSLSKRVGLIESALSPLLRATRHAQQDQHRLPSCSTLTPEAGGE